VHLLQRIDTLLELNVVGRELGLPCATVNLLSATSSGLRSRAHLVVDLADLLLDILLGPGSPWGKRGTIYKRQHMLERCLLLFDTPPWPAHHMHTYEMPFPKAVIFPRLSMVVSLRIFSYGCARVSSNLHRCVWSCLGELVESAYAHRDTETAAARPSSTPLNLKRLTLDP
jgi:hypothetical protein